MDFVRNLLPNSKYMPTSSRIPLREWIVRAGIILRNRQYSFDKHEYLEVPLDDTHENITYQKGAQVGISTLVLVKSLYVAEHMGKKVVYYFQDDKAVSDFSSDRAVPMIASSQYLTERMRDTNRVGLRQIGPGSIYFRGLQNKGKAKSIDSDMICLDELDEAPEGNVEFACDRLRHSDLGWTVALSQPSIPGFGINKRFTRSDQRHWNLICPGCGHRNCLELDFPLHFKEIPSNQKKSFPDGAMYYRGCSRCGTRLNPSVGEWIAKYPSRTLRGYHLSQLYSQILSPGYPNLATKIMDEYAAKRGSQIGLENFTISVLGFPFAGADVRITDELLDQIEGGHGFANREIGAFMGVDQGDVLSIVVGMISGQKFKVIYAEQTEKWGRLDTLMDAFGVHHCVIDAQPNKHSAKTFASKHPGRVSIQYFGSKELKQGVELLEGKTEIETVIVDRTDSIDAMIDRMEGGFIELPGRSKCNQHALVVVEDLRRHLKQLVSKTEMSARGVPTKVYLRGNSIENHYGMALNNSVLAAFELGSAPGPMVAPVFRKMGRA